MPIALFAAVVVVVVGSLISEALSYTDILRERDYGLAGNAGVVGMVIWVAIIYRGLRSRLVVEHRGN